MTISVFNKIAYSIPGDPGIYKFINKNNKILYVGKAKNLKKRISSYFKNHFDNYKTSLLVKKIHAIDFIIVETEQDALLLENNLIKKYQPYYNIQLKDAKTYPYICIKNENFSRISFTRNKIHDGSEYFGPYVSAQKVRIILDIISNIFQLRTCRFNLSKENILKKKFKLCLEYHLNRCKAPCEGLQASDEYSTSVRQVREILKGNIQSVIVFLKNRIIEYANNYQFEKANEIKDKLTLLTAFQNKSTVVNPKINNIDVFTIEDTKKHAYINFLQIVNGAIILSQTIELKKQLNENKEELLLFAIIELRKRFNSTSKEILTPLKLNIVLPEVKISVPQKGDKKKLLDLSLKNLQYYMLNRMNRLSKYDYDERHKNYLQQLQKDLRLKQLPLHIECFDNSNLQGSNPVSALVVFINGNHCKKEYRHYNIQTVQGINDYASMSEIVYKRYKRLVQGKKSLPQLIIIDGGKGQLNAALKSLKKLSLSNKIAIIGIAKRLEEIFYPNDSLPIYIDKKSESMKLIQRIRNEAHRFAINFHRNKRDKSTFGLELLEIKGIGNTTVQKLLREMKSVKKVKEANYYEIEKIIGHCKAQLICNNLQKTEKA